MEVVARAGMCASCGPLCHLLEVCTACMWFFGTVLPLENECVNLCDSVAFVNACVPAWQMLIMMLFPNPWHSGFSLVYL